MDTVMRITGQILSMPHKVRKIVFLVGHRAPLPRPFAQYVAAVIFPRELQSLSGAQNRCKSAHTLETRNR